MNRKLLYLKRLAVYFFAVIITLCLYPLPAMGYVPDANELLTDITAKRIQLDSLEVVYEISGHKPQEAEDESNADENGDSAIPYEIISFRYPNRIRINLNLPEGRETFLAVGIRTLVLDSETLKKAVWPQPFLVYRMLIDFEATRLRELLSSLNFNLNKVSLGRYQGKIVFILGARAGDLTAPQAWFERDNLRLVRLIMPAGHDSPAYDLKLSDYRLHDYILWPESLSVQLDKHPPQILSLKELTINPQVETDDPELESPNQDQPEEKDPEEFLAKDPDIIKIRKQMDWFRKKLE